MVVVDRAAVSLVISLYVCPPSRQPRIGFQVGQGLAGVGRLCDVRKEVAS
jgi:hypothetical protein